MEALASHSPLDAEPGLTLLSPALTWRHRLLTVTSSRPTDFVDITNRLEALIAAERVAAGIVNVQTLHTTTALVVNEHEPLLLSDFEATLERAASARDAYRHDDATVRTVNLTEEERVNGHAHCRALLLGPSVCLNILNGELRLVRWQRVFFVELDGPQTRQLSALVLGAATTRLGETRRSGR